MKPNKDYIYFKHSEEKKALETYHELCISGNYPEIYLVDSWNPNTPGLWIEFEKPELNHNEEVHLHFSLSEKREKTINQLFNE